MSTWQDDRGRWHAEASVDGRRLHRRCPPGASQGDAKLLEAQLLQSLHATPRLSSIPGNPLLSDLLGDYHDRHAPTLRSADTARYHALRIGQWVEGKRASDTRSVVASIIDDLSPVYAPATINRSLGTLSKSLADAWERGTASQDYSSLVKRLPENNERTVTWTLGQIRKIADCASERVRVAIWASLFTGCRRGEICKVEKADIGRDFIKLEAGNTKTLKYREVPIVAAARPWIAQLPLGITFEGVKSGWQRARAKAGLPEADFHDLRRSCGSLLIQSGASLHQVSKILGHSSTSVTEKRYAFLLSKDLTAAMERAFSPPAKPTGQRRKVANGR
jgi:integrase